MTHGFEFSRLEPEGLQDGISGRRDTGETIKVNIAVRAGFVLETRPQGRFNWLLNMISPQ
jgi:hypothetical protein